MVDTSRGQNIITYVIKYENSFVSIERNQEYSQRDMVDELEITGKDVVVNERFVTFATSKTLLSF